MLAHNRFFLTISLLASLVITSCGVAKQTAEAPQDGIQNTFFNNKFGDSSFRVKNRMRSKSLDLSSVKSQQKYTDLDFGGYNWHFVTFEFSPKDEFMIIEFSQEFKNEFTGQKRYDGLKDALDEKYGIGYPISNGVGYSDKYGRGIQLTLSYGESRGGEMFWYCNLMYGDITIVQKSNEAAAADL